MNYACIMRDESNQEATHQSEAVQSIENLSDDILKFQDYYVAYFDVLGYKEYFKKDETQILNFTRNLHSAINDAKNSLRALSSSLLLGQLGNLRMEHAMFSDNVVIYMQVTRTPFEKIRLLTFLTTICDIQRGFIHDYGLLLRGSVTMGPFLATNDYIAGQALIDVVEAEKNAIFPRITILPPIMKVMEENDYCNLTERRQEIQRISDNYTNTGTIAREDIQKWRQYIELMDWEIASRKWYMGVRCKLTDNDVPFLNYLYFLPITEIYPTIKEKAPTILPILEKISPFDAHTLQQELEAAPSERTRSFIKKHQQFLQASFNQYCHYHDINYACPEQIKARKHIIKKYTWLGYYHNYQCVRLSLKEYMLAIQYQHNFLTDEDEFFVQPQTDAYPQA